MTEAASSPPFEELMAAGVSFNNLNLHNQALMVRQQALVLAEPGSVDYGHALRDIGHSLAELGDKDQADSYARQALDVHKAAREAGQPRAERELRASAGYVGAMAFAGAVASEQNGKLDLILSQDALARLGEASDGPDDDQYTINFVGRFAAATALFTDRASGLKLARRAVRLGFRSESPKLPTSTPNLSPRERLSAKIKAVGRGVTAGAIAIINPKLREVPPPQTSRRKIALELAKRVA